MWHRLGFGATPLVALTGLWVSWVLIQTHVQVKVTGDAGGVCGQSETVNCVTAAQSGWSTLAGIPIAVLGFAFYIAVVVGWIIHVLRRTRMAEPAQGSAHELPRTQPGGRPGAGKGPGKTGGRGGGSPRAQDQTLVLPQGTPTVLLGADQAAPGGTVLVDLQAPDGIAGGDHDAAALASRAEAVAAEAPGLISSLYLMSVLYSLLLGSVSAFSLGAFCPYCMALYAINLLGFGAACLWSGAGPMRVVAAQLRALPRVLRSRVTLGMLIVFVGATGALSWSASQQVEERVTALQASARTVAPVVPAEGLRTESAASKGPADAELVLVEFSNFECPFCARFAESVDAVYPEFEGRLRVEFRHFVRPDRPNADRAARAALCAQEQERFWPMHEALFAMSPGFDPPALEQAAARLGMDLDDFRRCMSSASVARRIEADREAGVLMGVTGTPTFFINGRRYVGARDPGDLRRLLLE